MKDCNVDLPESEYGMSNAFHTIDEGMEADLRNGMQSTHAGWNFHGQVWFEDDQFHEAVRQYHVHVDTISADSLPELMSEVNAVYGSD